MTLNKKRAASIKAQNSFAELLEEYDVSAVSKFNFHFFQKYLLAIKFNSWIGSVWDVFQVVLALIACAIYVAETYVYTYNALQTYTLIENIITQFFLIDFILTWSISVSTRYFFTQFMTWIDMATILPVYISYIVSDESAPNLSILRFLRILRLIRILRTFRMLGGFSGVKRQSITLSLAMLSLIFLAAGVLNILENEINSLSYDCQHINSLTMYEPSCEADYPTFDDPSCDCKAHNCEPVYQNQDSNHKPSEIKCTDLAFFDSFYFIIITIYPVGYGSMIANNYSRMAMIIIIITSIVVIQMQVNKLSQLISMISPFRAPYEKHFQDKHVVLCGYVHDKETLSRFLREFFHPDRQNPREPGYHLVVLGPVEPSPELVDIINSPLFEGRLFYIVGSALNFQDLVKARADSAAAIMFQSNPELDTLGTVLDDAATVLRTMSVINFNPDLKCLVQVLQTSDRDLLKDSDADIVLCMDDYKTTLQARNAMCPGLATFVENIFHSFGSGRNNISKPTEHWSSEYKYGLQMELYYVNISQEFFEKLNFNWRLLVEVIYLEFDCMLLGVCRPSDQSLYLNPGKSEFNNYTNHAFFKSYTTGVLLAPDDASANAIAYALTDPQMILNLLNGLVAAEEKFSVRMQVIPPDPVDPVKEHRPAVQGANAAGLGSAFRRMSASMGLDSHGSSGVGNIIEAQNILDLNFTPDFTKKKNVKRKKRMSQQSQEGDSDSSGGDDQFLGYLDSDSEDFDQSDVDFSDATPKSKRVDAGNDVEKDIGKDTALVEDTQVEGISSTSLPTEPQENHAKVKLTRIFKRVVRDVHRKKQGAWIDVIRSLNIHGEVEIEDDESSLGLLQSRGRNVAKDRSEHHFGRKKGQTAPSHKNLQAVLSSSPTKRKPKLSLKGAGSKIKLGLMLKAKESDAGNDEGVKKALEKIVEGDSKSPEKSPEKSPQKLPDSEGKNMTMENEEKVESVSPVEKRLVLTQRLRGFQKKKSSSFSEKYECSSTHDARVKSGGPGIRSVVASLTFGEEDFTPAPMETEEETSFFELKGPKKKLVNVIGLELQNEKNDNASNNADDNKTDGFELADITSRLPSDRRSRSGTPLEKRSGTPKQKKSTSELVESKTVVEDEDEEIGYGNPSQEVANADKLRKHIVVMGCLDSILLFVRELRKPQQDHLSYHSVLIVGEEAPAKWEFIKKHFDDVYFLQNQVRSRGDIELAHMNIKCAHSLVLLASRERNSVDEATNIDSSAIFTYLKLHAHVPRGVFFTIELFLESSIGMLNSVVMRHLKSSAEDRLARKSNGMNTGMAVSKARRRRLSSLKVSGSSDTALHIEEQSLLSIASTDFGLTDDEHSQLFRDAALDHLNRKKSMTPLLAREGSKPHFGRQISRRQRVMPQAAKSIRKLIQEDKVLGKLVNKHTELDVQDNEEKENATQASLFWDTEGTHHVLPVFAASQVFVPTGFDSIFCNSFFGDYTPPICEKLICGQEHQTMHNVEVPYAFGDRKFGELFRAMNSRGVMPLALYRYKHPSNEAAMSYVFTCPISDTLLKYRDHVLVFGNSDVIKKVLQALSLPLSHWPGLGGKMSLHSSCLQAPRPADTPPLPGAESMAALKAAAVKYGGGIQAHRIHP